MTSHGREDVLNYYPTVPDNKVFVVPVGPALAAYADITQSELDAIADHLELQEPYLFYPAQTWKHKNHITLLQALAQLREKEGIVIPLLCSGRRNEFFPTIQRTVKALNLGDQVRFLGFVSPQELQALYHYCHAVAFPSLYEGFGMPVLEAFQAGRPLACANIPVLTDIVQDAALLFDPANANDMAQAIRRLWFDEKLRQTLRRRADKRVAEFDWIHTTRIFRAHHRRIAGRPLTSEDQQLLAAKPIV